MDLVDDIRCKLYNWIRSDLSDKRTKIVDEAISNMKDIVATWIIGRIDNKVMKASKSIPSSQIHYYQGISFTKDNLEIDKDELFSKFSKILRRRYYNYYINIDMIDKRIPYFPWFKQFNNRIQNFIETPKEMMMYRELQNLALKIYTENYELEKFDSDFCMSDGWGWFSSGTFLKPQGIDSVEQFQRNFPEWYDKYYIPQILIDKPEGFNISGYEGLIGILKK
jgi:hypothetical protein